MNWDWEKLQQNRQRTTRRSAPDNGNDKPPTPFKKPDFGDFIPKFGSGVPALFIAGALVFVWLLSGIFIINPGEVGVVLQFGKHNRTVGVGPHYRLPFPIEETIVVNTEQLRTIMVGQSADNARFANQSVTEESSMFTGDENIVHMQFNVQYNIRQGEADRYLFNVYATDTMVGIAAEAAMREVVGSMDIDAILTTERAGVQTRAQEVLQAIMDKYDSGIAIHAVQLLDVQPPSEVAEAFKDVASAREDRQRFKNEAEAYHNEIVPLAIGTAKSMVNAAEGYRQRVILEAEGEASRFLALAEEYKKAKDITTTRLRMEALADVLASAGLEKIILSGSGKTGYLPFLNLDRAPGVATGNAPATDAKTNGGNLATGGKISGGNN